MLAPLSVPSLILGFYVINSLVLVAGGKMMSPKGKQAVSRMQSMFHQDTRPNPHPHHPDSNQNTPIPNLARFLERKVDMRKVAPRKRHLKPQRLLRRMGRDFDSFWMSQKLPNDFSKLLTKRNVNPALRPETSSLDLQTLAKDLLSFNNNNLEDATTSDANTTNSNTTYNTNNNKNILDPAPSMPKAIDTLQTWLVQIASCPVYYKWQDFGLLYWPRWVRFGSCSRPVDGNPIQTFIRSRLSTTSDATSSTTAFPTPSPNPCSWPTGMHCIPGKEKKLRLLRWTCKNLKQSEEFDKHHRRPSKKSNSNKVDTTHNSTATTATSSHDVTHNHHEFDFNHHHDDDDFHHHDDDDHHDFHHHISNHHNDNEHNDDDDDGDDVIGDNEPEAINQFINLFSRTQTKTEDKPPRDKRLRHQSSSKESSRHHNDIFAQTPTETKTKTKSSEKLDKELEEFLQSKLVNTTPFWTGRKLRHIPARPSGGGGARSSSRRARRASVRSQRSDGRHHNPHYNSHGKPSRRGKKRRSGFRCRWVKITIPVVDDCHCSC